MIIRNISFLFILFTFLISICNAQVSLVKEKFLVSENKNQILQLNKKYFVLDKDGKKVALVKVVKLQNNKALCQIINGKPQTGQLLFAIEEVPKKQIGWTQGLQLSYSQMTLSVAEVDSLLSAETVKLSGSAIKFQYLLEKPINKIISSSDSNSASHFKMGGLAGVQLVSLASTAQRLVCDNQTSNDCTFNVTYAALSAYLKHHFYNTMATDLYYKIATDYLYPVSKKSTAFVESKINAAATAQFYLGANINMGSGAIPIELGYVFHQKTADVEYSELSLSIGYNWE